MVYESYVNEINLILRKTNIVSQASVVASHTP